MVQVNRAEAKALVAKAVGAAVEGTGLHEFTPNVPELDLLFSEVDITYAPGHDDARALVREAFRELVDTLVKPRDRTGQIAQLLHESFTEHCLDAPVHERSAAAAALAHGAVELTRTPPVFK
jgi:hypothetical protein